MRLPGNAPDSGLFRTHCKERDDMTLRFDRRPACPVRFFAAALFLGLSGSAAFAQNAAPNGTSAPGKVDDAATLTRFLDPLSRPKDGPEVAIDVTAAPYVKPWAEKASAL